MTSASGPCFELKFHPQKVKVNESGSRVNLNDSNEIHTDGGATLKFIKFAVKVFWVFIIKKTMLVLLCCLSAILTSRKNKHNHIRNFSESTLST